MKRGLFTIVVIMILVLLLTACGGTVKLTEDMNGQSITVNKGDEIELKINGNPTTGYLWEIKDLDESILSKVGEDYKSDSMLIGSGGTYTYTFEAVETGTTTLNLIYHRTFEKDIPPLETYSVTIEIQD